MRIAILAGAFALGSVAPAIAQGEAWSLETLEQNARDFVADNWLTRLEQVAKLVSSPPAWPTIQQAVHGDHREYMVKVRGLLQGLTNERWLERERAELALVEVGARARELLRDRVQSGETLEERDRVRRVLDRIEQRGTEDEDRRIRLLRGFVLSSLYLQGNDDLRKALVSALGHTDGAVVNLALRALGKHATAAEAPALTRQLDLPGAAHRLTALCALARVDAPATRAALGRLLDAGTLNDVEALHVLRVARNQPGGQEIVAKFAASPKALFRAVSSIVLPAPGTGPRCEVTLSDRTELKCRFGGMAGDAVLASETVPGLAVFEAPLAVVSLVRFCDPDKPDAPARVFLTQGSLLTGKLVAIDPESVKLENDVLGTMTVPRAQVQGILFASDLDRLIGGSPSTDRVRSADNSLKDVEVMRLGAQGLVVRDQTMAETTLRREDVAGILFRRLLTTTADATQYSRLVLKGGDRVLGHIVGVTPTHVAFVLPGQGDSAPIAAAVVPCDKIATMEFLVGGGASWGYTIIADYSDNRIIEVDEKGREVFALDDVFGAWDVECLDNGNLLITEFSVSRVQEVTRAGKPVWAFEDLKNPYDADRLPNGNTLIADTFGGRVIEVDKSGKIVWQYANEIRPFDCDRLANGNTLIADVLHERVIEVAPDGQIAWELRNMKLVHDADRLPNGNTLITLREAKKVIEVDGGGHERGMRSGTLNVTGIVGMGEAARISREEMAAEVPKLRALRDRLEARLLKALPDCVRNGDPDARLPHLANVSFPYVEGESLIMGIKEIAVSSGSACTSASLEPSYVLKSLGLGDELAHSSIRFSLGRFTTTEEVDFAADRVITEVKRLREMSPLWEMVQEGVDLSKVKWTVH